MVTSNKYDYKPLLIQIFDSESKHMKNLLIDGTTFDACTDLALDNMKKLDGSYFEISCRKTDKLLRSSRYETTDTGDYMSWEEIEELVALTKKITEEAKIMVEDYNNNPSTYKGQVDTKKNLVKGDGVVIHSDSPILDENDDE